MAVQEEFPSIEPERLPDLIDFVDEARNSPEIRLVRLIAVIRAELVVVGVSIGISRMPPQLMSSVCVTITRTVSIGDSRSIVH